MRRGIEAKLEVFQWQKRSESEAPWGFRLRLEERLVVTGDGFKNQYDADESARRVASELGLIVVEGGE